MRMNMESGMSMKLILKNIKSRLSFGQMVLPYRKRRGVMLQNIVFGFCVIYLAVVLPITFCVAVVSVIVSIVNL